MKTIAETVDRLCEASRRDFSNPYLFDWPRDVDQDAWYMSPELISIYGTPFYEDLTDIEQKKLSFYEAVHFFSLNIHGEKPLVEGLARRLYQKNHHDISDYLHHFLDEENKHMVYFAGFCLRYAGKIYPDKKMTLPREYAPGEEDFLFFAKVLIFEEIVDVYNIRMALDERVAPLARDINALHHRDEARHLVFGRQLVRELFQASSPHWPAEVLKRVQQYLADYFVATWREYYNPEVYRDCGFPNPYEVYEKAWEHPACRRHRMEVSKGCIEYLRHNGMLLEVPAL